MAADRSTAELERFLAERAGHLLCTAVLLAGSREAAEIAQMTVTTRRAAVSGRSPRAWAWRWPLPRPPPVRLADAVPGRLAVPVPGDDLLTPFLGRVPPAAWPPPGPRPPRWPLAALPARPRYEPRNRDFAGGLDRRDLDSWPGPGRPTRR